MTDFTVPMKLLNKYGNPVSGAGKTKLTYPSGIDGSGTSFVIKLVPVSASGQAWKCDLVHLPVADFSVSVTGGCAPLNVSFSGTDSAYADSYLYTFGNGATSGDQSPSYNYTVGGLYDVSLAATGNIALATDTLTRNDYIEVLTPPVADFSGTPTTGQATLAVDFLAGTVGEVSSWLWSFGDGATSGFQNPSHEYSEGTFSVSLAEGNRYCSDSETKPDYIVVTAGGGSGQWISKFGTAEWLDYQSYGYTGTDLLQCYNIGTWNSTNFSFDSTDFYNSDGDIGKALWLEPNIFLNDWAKGYIPTKVRISYTGSFWHADFHVYSTSGEIVCRYECDGNPNKEAIITFSTPPIDDYSSIRWILIYTDWNPPESFSITNIEFWEP